VYEAMAPENFDAAALDYAEGHLRILSGLYGMLRPLDRVQPYRLEMGYRFAPEGVRSLREFWKARLTEALRQELSAQAEPVVVNLASKEYSDAIDLKALPGKVITPVFKVKQGSDPARQVAIYAKRGRGALAGYLCRQQAGIAPLTDFAEDGWRYQPTDSTAAAPLFIREL
ncbi:MAG: YaaA family protein, partial [Verrucomicrobiota bacterium]